MAKLSYELTESITESTIRYYFVSVGKEDIIKAIDYSYAGDLSEKKIYNLAFGDYHIDTDEIDDSVNSDNGDAYHVFNTVLNSIPKFFTIYRDAVMLVRGSDSGDSFINACKPTCKKKCSGDNICKNQNRRINVYRKYINSNFDTLSKEYAFYGGIQNDSEEIEVEPYMIGKMYDSVLVVKNNS